MSTSGYRGGGPFRIGVDIGGTFSDFVILDEAAGEVRILKVPSTPSDPSIAVLNGLQQLTQRGMARGSVRFFSHGTTVSTNALLEGKGATVGLLITRGFRAIQEVRDQTRGTGAAVYDPFFDRAPMLVPQQRTGEAPERLDHRGEIVQALDEAAVRAVVRQLATRGVDSFAVCLLFSFMNPDHEQRVGRIILEEAPGVRVSLSSEVLPVIREYYRLSTTQVNAYVAPRLASYLEHMVRRLEDQDVTTDQRYVMQSNGGMTSFASSADRAVTTILSGPAGGVIAGARLSKASGFPNVITFDIGGTSTDIALVEGGTPTETTTGLVAGYHVGVPMLDINTISAGGGTIAWIDRVGTLRCGPQSAGAEPGPACYGKGGEEPTITDANLVLGYLNPDNFLGGELPLYPDLAARAVSQRVAEPLSMTLEEAAAGIVRLINVHMAQGVRAVSSERGYDLREFAIVAFGGAGPVHASEIARELGIPTVIVPRYPGLTSAMGLLMSDVKHDYARSVLVPLDEVTPEEANAVFTDLDARARTELSGEGFEPGDIQLIHTLDLRYAGQGYELRVGLADGPATPAALRQLRTDFDDLHERLHGHRAEGEGVEVVSYWTIGVARVPKVVLTPSAAGAAASPAPVGTRRAWFPNAGWVQCPSYSRETLSVGAQVHGPAIVEQVDSTTVVHPDQQLRVDAYHNLILQVALNSSPLSGSAVGRMEVGS